MATYEIPLSPEAQTFSIDLAGVEYQLTLVWNSIANIWVLNLTTANGNSPILSGIPLVANTDLLAPYGYLNLGGQLVAKTDNNPFNPPTYENLGVTGRLYFITT